MHYEVIEIGVCDYQIDSDNANGPCLLVEPHPVYHRKLLDHKKNNWRIHQGAVSDTRSRELLFYVSEEDVESNGLPWWIRACASIKEPSMDLVNYCPHLVQAVEVDVMTLSDLFEKYQVSSLDMFKTDLEGHDEIVLAQYVDIISENRDLEAQTIDFENKWFSSLTALEATEATLLKIGYGIRRIEDRTVAKRTESS